MHVTVSPALQFPLLIVVLLILLGGRAGAESRSRKTQNIFLITTDGLRWQEIFSGAEAALMNKKDGGVKDTNGLRRDFLRDTPEERRAVLFPFIWGTLAKQGQLWGNQNRRSTVRVTNGRNFSYPGYSEFLTGIVDASIDSNDKRPNPNTNVFEWLNLQREFHGKVAATVSWGVIPWVLNVERSHLPVWSAFELPPGITPIPMPATFRDLLANSTPIWADVSLDTYTAFSAREIVRKENPRAFYIAYGETDDWAHEGRYDLYLRAAHNFDRNVGELWTLVQSMPAYRNCTTFVLATDHGRGSGPVAWKNHSRAIAESSSIWLAVMGPDTPPLGERADTANTTQSQIAATVAGFLGRDYCEQFPKAAKSIAELLPKR
ncbi:MAG: AP protein [Pedosphaera sp.]|nr:AP protein [Pedosphaera sp.]